VLSVPRRDRCAETEDRVRSGAAAEPNERGRGVTVAEPEETLGVRRHRDETRGFMETGCTQQYVTHRNTETRKRVSS
jgi:hypothetical protein